MNSNICYFGLFLLTFSASCSNYVEFIPVYLEDDKYVIKKEAVDSNFRSNIIKVFQYYKVHYELSNDSKVLVPKKVWQDTELMYNFTKKAEDPSWLRNHPTDEDYIVFLPIRLVDGEYMFSKEVPAGFYEKLNEVLTENGIEFKTDSKGRVLVSKEIWKDSQKMFKLTIAALEK